MSESPDDACCHRADQHHRDRCREGRGPRRGEQSAEVHPRGIEARRDRAADTESITRSAKPGAGSISDRELSRRDDLSLSLGPLAAFGAMVEVFLSVRRECTGHPCIEIVGREMRSGNGVISGPSYGRCAVKVSFFQVG